MSSGDFRSFLICVLIFLWEWKSFFSIKCFINSFSTGVVMSILLQPSCFSSSEFNPLQFCKFNLSSLSGVHLICPKLSLFFTPSHPFSQWFSFHARVFFSLCFCYLFFRVLSGDSLWRFSGASCSSLFNLVIFSGEFNSAIRVHHILFVLVILSYVGNSYESIFLLSFLSILSGVLKLSQVFLVFRSFIISRFSTSSSFPYTGAISL